MLILSLIIFLVLAIILSSVGLGGGAFYVPVLLILGYPFHDASIISLFLITITGFSAFSRFWRADLVDWKLAIAMDTFTDLGAFIGGYTAIQFSSAILKSALSFFLILSSVVMIIRSTNPTPWKLHFKWGTWTSRHHGETYSINLFIVIPITFFIGYLSGALGVAGGLLKIPLMVIVFGVPQKIAVATSSLMVGLTGLFGLVGHGFHYTPNWLHLVLFGLIVLIGAQIGSHISIKMNKQVLNKWIAFVFSIMGIWILITSIF